MSAYPSPTTGPGPGQQTLLPAPKPIIPVVPGQIQPSVPGQIQPSREDYNDASRSVVERTATISGVETLLPIIYGTDQTGAKITAVVASGANLLLRCEWCSAYGYGIDAVQSYFVDGVAPSGGITATHYTGTQTTPDSTLVAAYAAQGKSYTDTLAGIAYSVVSVPAGVTQGFPRIVAQIRGQKVRTTLAGSYAFNENPVWLIAWLLVDRLGVAIDWTAFATAAAVCDATVGSPPEKKYTIGLSLETEQDVWKWVDLVLGYCRGFRWFDNGLHGITIGNAAQTTSGYVTESLMSNGDIEIKSRNVKNQPTVVRIYYTNLQNGLAADDFAEAQLPGVGTTLPYWLSEIRKSGINRFSQANREAIEALNDLYLGDTFVNFGTRDQGLKYLPGDVVELTHSRGLSGKKVHVLSNAPTDAGRWRMETREYDPAMYSSVVVTTPTYPDTSLPTPSSPPTVTGLALTEIVEAPGPGGTPSSSISATVTAVTWPFLSKYVWYAYDQAGNLIDEGETVGPSWRSIAFSAPRVVTVYCKARSTLAIASGYASASITLSGSTSSLTLLTSTRVFSAGSSLLNYEAFTLYPGDPFLRVAPIPSTNPTFAQQFTTDTISAATPNVLSHNRFLISQYRSSNYAKTAAVDLGASKTFVAAVTGAPTPNDFYLMIGFESATSLAGPWTFAKGTVVTLAGRYVRMVVAPRDDPPTYTLPDGGAVLGAAPWGSQYAPADFSAATISVYGATVEETGTITTSASAAVTVTLANKYAALRDLQVTAVQSGGTAVVTADAPSLSITLANTFQINATVSGTRVAVPVRWNFKGAL